MAESSHPVQSEPESSTNARINRDSIKKGLVDFRHFASTNLTRAVQYVTEKAGKADIVTEYGVEYETLCTQLDHIKAATEKMLLYVEAIVEPNPNTRWENWARTKIAKAKTESTSAHLLLSAELWKASNTFGTDTQYGAYLAKCSDIETKLGDSQKKFQENAYNDYIIPLKAFLEVDIKNVLKEKKFVAVKRLDLDAAQGKAKKAQTEEKLQAAESELRTMQAEYEMELGKVRTSLKKIVDTHVNHMGYMRKFMAAQRAYHSECQTYLSDIEGSFSLSTHVNPLVLSGEPSTSSTFTVNGLELDRDEAWRGKMVYDYEAQNNGELTINSGELVNIYPIPDDDDYVVAEFQGNFGRVLSTYVEKL